MPAVHFKNAYSSSVCGRPTKLFTEKHSDVTCKQCIRSIAATSKRITDKAEEDEVRKTGLAKLAALAAQERRRMPGSSSGTDVQLLGTSALRLRVTYTVETKIVGVTHLNENGSERQAIIQRCFIGEELNLVREPDCPFDPLAIGVFCRNGDQLGYLSREFSGGGTAVKMDAGGNFQCCIKNIVGGFEGKNFGVNVLVSNGNLPEKPSLLPGVIFRPNYSEREKRSDTPYRVLALIAILVAVVYLVVKYR